MFLAVALTAGIGWRGSVAFSRAGDSLTLRPGAALSLSIEGPTAPAAGDVEHNLVLRAARNFAARFPHAALGAFHLVKRLPVAAGIGGGSSDAAAALRLLARANDVSLSDQVWSKPPARRGRTFPSALAPARA